MRRLGICLVLAACFAAASSAPAGAATPSSVASSPAELESARKLFAEAERDQLAEKWELAVVKLGQVADIKDTAGVRFHIGNCLEHLGRLLEALDNFQKAQSLAEGSRTQDVLQAVGPRIDLLLARIPTLTIRLSQADRDAVVRIDDKPIARHMIGAPVGQDPGKHRISVEFPGLPVIRRELTLAESRAEILDFARPVAPPVASPARPPPTPAQAPPPQPSSAAVPVGAWIALGAGALLAVGGVFAFQHAGSVADDSQAACARSIACDPQRAATVQRYDAIALGLWSGAVAAAGAGVIWTWTAHKSSPTHASLALQSGSVSVRGSF